MIKFTYKINNCGQPAPYTVGGVKANNLIAIFMKNASNRNRNLKTSKALLKSQAHQSTTLFTSTVTNQRFFPKGGQEKLRSDIQKARRGQSSSNRVPRNVKRNVFLT